MARTTDPMLQYGRQSQSQGLIEMVP